jgi:flagellar biosynthesis GTPase FlhF
LEARNVTVYLTAFTEGKMEPEDTLDEAYELEEVETEGQETDSDSSPDTEEVQEKQTKPVFDEQQQQVFDKAIADKVFKLREKEREAEELKQRLQSLEQQIPKQERPSVPKEPDPYALSDQEYQQQLRMRDEAIARQAAFDAQQRFQQQEAQRLQQEQLMREQEALNEKVATYSQRAVQLGISNEELQAAGNAVASFGISDDVVNYILDDDLGPAITKYLSQNVTELDAIRAMSPAQAAVRIATHVRDKAAALKPKVNAAPDPVEQPAKAGVAPKARGPKGAIFE